MVNDETYSYWMTGMRRLLSFKFIVIRSITLHLPIIIRWQSINRNQAKDDVVITSFQIWKVWSSAYVKRFYVLSRNEIFHHIYKACIWKKNKRIQRKVISSSCLFCLFYLCHLCHLSFLFCLYHRLHPILALQEIVHVSCLMESFSTNSEK